MKRLFFLLFCALNYVAALAQPVCDSVTIEKVHYDPFYDTAIRVNATNHSSVFIGYPMFRIMTTGATIAEEQLHKFGFVGESYHSLDVRPTAGLQNDFHGYLILTGYDSVNCVFERDFSLCPDTCQMIYPFVGYFGPTGISGTLNWTIERNNTQVVASGQLALDSTNPSDRDSVCLSPGSYTFKIRGSLTPGENPYFSINTKESQYFLTPYDSSGFDIPFHFFKRCPDPTAILVRQPRKDGYNIYASGQTVHIIADAAANTAPVSIYTIDGRRVYGSIANSGHMVINLSHVPAGVYIVRIAAEQGFVNKKIVLTAY